MGFHAWQTPAPVYVDEARPPATATGPSYDEVRYRWQLNGLRRCVPARILSAERKNHRYPRRPVQQTPLARSAILFRKRRRFGIPWLTAVNRGFDRTVVPLPRGGSGRRVLSFGFRRCGNSKRCSKSWTGLPTRKRLSGFPPSTRSISCRPRQTTDATNNRSLSSGGA